MKTILILKDNNERIAVFQRASAALGGSFALKIRRDAHSKIAESEKLFPATVVISLDHDLNPEPGAARHADSYADALWATVARLGDRDTSCAVVGGIVALSAGRESIPADWLRAREPIQIL